MTTVQECIQNHVKKNRNCKVWLCPSITIKPRVGIEYSIELRSNDPVPDILKDVEVRKHFIEDDTLCIIFQNTQELEFKLYK